VQSQLTLSFSFRTAPVRRSRRRPRLPPTPSRSTPKHLRLGPCLMSLGTTIHGRLSRALSQVRQPGRKLCRRSARGGRRDLTRAASALLRGSSGVRGWSSGRLKWQTSNQKAVFCWSTPCSARGASRLATRSPKGAKSRCGHVLGGGAGLQEEGAFQVVHG
jgi:hypothetical protein